MAEAVGYITEIHEHLFRDMSRQLTSVSLTTPIERYRYTTLLISFRIEKVGTTVDPVSPVNLQPV